MKMAERRPMGSATTMAMAVTIKVPANSGTEPNTAPSPSATSPPRPAASRNEFPGDQTVPVMNSQTLTSRKKRMASKMMESTMAMVVMIEIRAAPRRSQRMMLSSVLRAQGGANRLEAKTEAGGRGHQAHKQHQLRRQGDPAEQVQQRCGHCHTDCRNPHGDDYGIPAILLGPGVHPDAVRHGGECLATPQVEAGRGESNPRAAEAWFHLRPIEPPITKPHQLPIPE